MKPARAGQQGKNPHDVNEGKGMACTNDEQGGTFEPCWHGQHGQPNCHDGEAAKGHDVTRRASRLVAMLASFRRGRSL